MSRIETDAIDGRLIAKVLQLMEVNQALQSHLGEASLNQKLEMAILFFLMQFRKSYISETNVVSKQSNAYLDTITNPKTIIAISWSSRSFWYYRSQDDIECDDDQDVSVCVLFIVHCIIDSHCT